MLQNLRQAVDMSILQQTKRKGYPHPVLPRGTVFSGSAQCWTEGIGPKVEKVICVRSKSTLGTRSPFLQLLVNDQVADDDQDQDQ